MKYNFCKNCGSPVQPGMTNCQRCGAPVDQVQPVDENKPMAQPPGMLKQYYDPNNEMPQQPVTQQQVGTPMAQKPMPPVNNYQQPTNQVNNMNQPMPQYQQPVNNYPQGQPYQQPVNQIQQGNSASAIGSALGAIACGAISFFIFWWLSICGVGFAATAIKQGKDQNNKGALILGVIGMLLCIACVVIYFLNQSGITLIQF